MIRVGILGYGYWGQLLTARAMAVQGVCVAAIADRDVEKRKKAELLPDMVVCRDLDDLLQEHVSAIIVATPASTHETIVSTALNERMHVFCEKPLALSYKASAQLVADASQIRRVLHVDHTFLFTEQFKQIEALFRDDAVRFYRSHRINVSGARNDVSIFEDLGVHDLALLDALAFDEPEAISLNAAEWPTPDSATLRMTFPLGCSAWVKVAWCQPAKRRDITITGNHTRVEWQDTGLTVHRCRGDHVLFSTFGEPSNDAVTNSLLAFFKCIETSSLANLEAKRATRIASTLERIRASVPAPAEMDILE